MNENITKLFIASLFLGLSATAYAQEGAVGINTTAPRATLDIVAFPTDLSKADGLLAPRLTRLELSNKGDTLYGVNY